MNLLNVPYARPLEVVLRRKDAIMLFGLARGIRWQSSVLQLGIHLS